ncbi:MAG: CsgG/HfaB family protein [Campylobacterota bacterium]|nr:CsgG/HfaB family protein [Campylobacterota bacterium]
MRYFKLLIFTILTLKTLVASDVCQNPYDGLIGVTDVEIANKTAQLVFNKSGVQSQAAVALKETHCFNVLDWQRLKEVIQRNKIDWSDLKNSQEQRSRLKNLLAVDYFLVVSIASFSDDTEFSNSSFSKSKKQVVKVKVNLMIKDALTNELLETVSSDGEASKSLTQSLGFGASGNPTGELPNKALSIAINKGIDKLITSGLPELSSNSKNFSAKPILATPRNREATPKVQETPKVVKKKKDPFSLLAQKSSATNCPGKWIKSRGVAGLEKGSYIAKKRAIMDAYRNAVSRGSGVSIEEFTQAKMTQSMSDVYSVINKKAKGFITYYEILSDGQKNKRSYEVTMKACVADKEVHDFNFENGLKMFVQMLGSPTVLVVFGQERYSEEQLVEKTIHKKHSTEKYIAKKDEMQIRSVETAVAKILKEYGYEVTTSDDLSNRGIATQEKILKARKGIGGAAIEFARDAGANIVVSGNIVYALSRSEVSDVSGKLVTASINAKVLMPGSGKSVGIYNEQEQAFSLLDDQLTAKENAIKKTAATLTDKIVWDIPKYLLGEEREIEIQLSGVTYRGLRNIKKVLKRQKEILAIRDTSKWKKTKGKRGKVRLLVQTSYLGVTVDDIIDILEKNRVNIDINEATDYFINLSVI